MYVNTFLFGAVAYPVIVFPIAILWHLVLFKETYDTLGYISREEPIFALGLLSMLIQGPVLSYCYPLFQRGGNKLAETLRFAVVMWLFLGSSHVVAAAAKHPIEPFAIWFVIEPAYLAIQFGLVSLALAWIYRRGATANAAAAAALG